MSMTDLIKNYVLSVDWMFTVPLKKIIINLFYLKKMEY